MGFPSRIKTISLLLFFLLAAMPAYAQSVSEYSTMNGIRYRGYINCGTDLTTNAFAETLDNGASWTGFDADICKALSLAVFGFPDRFRMVSVTAENRYDALRRGQIDILLGGAPYLPSSDSLDKIIFAAPLFMHEQGFVGHFKENAKSMTDYKKSRVCVRKNTTVLDNLIFYNKLYRLGFRIFPVETFSQAREYLFLKHCDLYADYQEMLRSKELKNFPANIDLVALPETIAIETAGAAVKDDDAKWFKIVRWVIRSLVLAETKNVTRENAGLLENTQDPQIQNLLGINPNLGARLGLAPRWGINIIKDVGNYGEIFERNLGKDSQFNFSRGVNMPISEGGFLWTPSFN
ncbi:MAG: transporter substrate-binding domain-containing protein [Alphaproteobacteria bacterium]